MHLVMAMTLLAVVPSVLIFIFAQSYPATRSPVKGQRNLVAVADVSLSPRWHGSLQRVAASS